MATRSRIGIELMDGSIKSIYCHWDGYPEGVGKVLKENYTDAEKVKKLIDLGDISSLGKEYNEEMSKKDWTRFDKNGKLSPEEEKKLRDLTVAYKDRGEDCPARIDKDVIEFQNKVGNCGEEYTYLFTKGWRDYWHWEILETPYFSPLEDFMERRKGNG